MEYNVIYDIADSACDSRPLFWGVGIVIMVVFQLVLARRRYRRFLGFSVIAGIIGLVVSAGLMVGGGRVLSRCKSLKAALSDGRVSVVVGIVEEFHPQPFQGHDLESFVVAGRKFSYSDFTTSAGYHKSMSHHGILHPGMVARIYYVDNDILRIETPK